MKDTLDISSSHFKQMRKHLANAEKEWTIGAIAGVKEELEELDRMAEKIEQVIKNRLYYNLSVQEEKDKENGKTNNSEGWGSTSSEE